MFTTIQKWGNSQAIRLPKAILQKAGLNENDQVELKIENGNVVILPLKKHTPLADRISEYKGEYSCKEWNTGNPTGDEVL